jgi:hypothetical protein
VESGGDSEFKKVRVLQPYRGPHIPVVSDRYGFHLFEQTKNIDFAALSRPITHFDYLTFLDIYRLGDPQASNFFVVIYTSESESPLSGNPSMETIFQESGIGARERGNLLRLINNFGQCCC